MMRSPFWFPQSLLCETSRDLPESFVRITSAPPAFWFVFPWYGLVGFVSYGFGEFVQLP